MPKQSSTFWSHQVAGQTKGHRCGTGLRLLGGAEEKVAAGSRAHGQRPEETGHGAAMAPALAWNWLILEILEEKNDYNKRKKNSNVVEFVRFKLSDISWIWKSTYFELRQTRLEFPISAAQ